jgi:23S rRNA (adenine2030-N6)-methyltransferase
MNYRHAFHAGNHADVLKHVVMARILTLLKKKDKPFRSFDAHAGIGVYALDGAEALKTNEWHGGIAKMEAPFAPAVEELLAPYRSIMAALNPDGGLRFYPGSPEIIARLSRAEDRFTLNELHPLDFDLLKGRYGHDIRAGVSGIDATVLMKAALPPPERRGLVLIDPPYEVKTERELAMQALQFGHRRFATGVFMIWYPVKGARFAEDLCAAFQALRIPSMLRLELRVRESFDGGGLAGSGLIIVNPPFGLEEELRVLGPALAERLGIGTWGKATVDWLVAKP